MAKAAKRLSRKTSTRKSATPLLRLSSLGRDLLAAILDQQAHCWLDPERANVSEELADDQHYCRAWKRIADRQWGEIDRLTTAVMAAPLSLPNLADRVLIQHQFYDSDEFIESYLPGARRTSSDKQFQYHMPAIAALVALSDLPQASPAVLYDAGRGPADAEARVLTMLGKRRPKRKALSSTETKAIADAAAAAAVAKAAAAVTAAPGNAPFFA